MTIKSEHESKLSFSSRLEPDAVKLGRRICIYGRGGKTSLSRALGDRTGLPVIELDAIFWLPNWKERDHGEMLQIVKTRIAEANDSWIVDGNYRRIRPHVLPLADTVIWLNLPRWSTTLRVAKRTISNALKRTQICGDNYESIRSALSPDSVTWYNAFDAQKSQSRVAEELNHQQISADVYEIRTYRQLRKFYERCGLDHRAYRT